MVVLKMFYALFLILTVAQVEASSKCLTLLSNALDRVQHQFDKNYRFLEEFGQDLDVEGSRIVNKNFGGLPVFQALRPNDLQIGYTSLFTHPQLITGEETYPLKVIYENLKLEQLLSRRGLTSILSVGEGRSPLVRELRSQGHIAFGLDRWYRQPADQLLPELIEFRESNGLSLIPGEAETIPFKSNTFDLVLSHVSYVSQEGLGEIIRVLKPGGIARIVERRLASQSAEKYSIPLEGIASVAITTEPVDLRYIVPSNKYEAHFTGVVFTFAKKAPSVDVSKHPRLVASEEVFPNSAIPPRNLGFDGEFLSYDSSPPSLEHNANGPALAPKPAYARSIDSFDSDPYEPLEHNTNGYARPVRTFDFDPDGI